MKSQRIHLGHVLGVAAFLAIPFAIFMSKALAPLFMVTAVWGLVLFFLKERSLPVLPKFFTAFFAMVVIWGGTSSLWSISPSNSLHLSLSLAVTFLAGLVLVFLANRLRQEEQRFFENALIAGVVVGGVFMAIEINTPLKITSALRYAVYGVMIDVTYTYANYYKIGATLISLMIWPAMVVLWKRKARIAALVLFSSALYIIFTSSSGSSILAIMASMAVVVIAYAFQKRAVWIFGFLVFVNVSIMPLASDLMLGADEIRKLNIRIPESNLVTPKIYNIADSIYPRIFIWKSAATLIHETPLLGKGLDTSRSISSEKDKVFFTKNGFAADSTRWEGKSEPIPLHPHNTVLQVWLELGAFGAVMLLVLLLALIRRIDGLGDPFIRAFCFGALFTPLTIANVSYGVWQSWWQGALWLTAAFVVAILSRNDDEEIKKSA